MSIINRLKSLTQQQSYPMENQEKLKDTNEYIVRMSQVSVNYKERRNILNIPEFKVRPGELVAILGPNGAGKSTLLRTINLLQSYSGEIELFGNSVSNTTKTWMRRRSALVFQETLLLNDTVFNNVAQVLKFRGVPANKIKEKVHTALATFGCDRLVNRPAHSLSGGEAKRVCIACGLVADAELLLLDEPSASLDIGIRGEVIEKIRQVAQARGTTVILVSHNFTDILNFADRAVGLFDGCIVQDDKLEMLIRRPANENLARLVGMDNILPCRVERNSRGYLINLANSVEFHYFGELNTPITACCLSGDAFYLDDISYPIPDQQELVSIEGWVQKIIRGIGTYTIRARVGEQTLIARVPRSRISDDLYHHGKIKLAFNPRDAHFV